MKAQITEALRLQFRPEFLNRIDEVIVFHASTTPTSPPSSTCSWPTCSGVWRHSTSSGAHAGGALPDRPRGDRPGYGARPLKRTIQRLVENPLARAWFAARSSLTPAWVADADAIGGVVVFRSGGATVVADAGERRDARRRAATRDRPHRGGRGPDLDAAQEADGPKKPTRVTAGLALAKEAELD